MKTVNILISGFGGQGVLFLGKFLAYAGMLDGKEVTWLPSYGPEMRGGTASCSVIISDSPIGSPLVPHPDILVAMNRPSLDRFENDVPVGGSIYYDSTLAGRDVTRRDVKSVPVPASKAAGENGMPTMANMILLGKILSDTGMVSKETIPLTISKIVSAKRQNLVELNEKAIKLGESL